MLQNSTDTAFMQVMSRTLKHIDLVSKMNAARILNFERLPNKLRQWFKFALQSGSDHFRAEFCISYAICLMKFGAAIYVLIVKGKETAFIGWNDCISKRSDQLTYSLKHAPWHLYLLWFSALSRTWWERWRRTESAVFKWVAIIGPNKFFVQGTPGAAYGDIAKAEDEAGAYLLVFQRVKCWSGPVFQG